MPQASPAPQARKALSELLAIAEQEAALIVQDDFESIVELQSRKAPLQEEFAALPLSSLTPAEGEETRSGVVWSNLDAPLGNPSPLLHKGLLYLLSSRGGELACLDAATGDMVYQEKVPEVGATWATPWVPPRVTK